MLCRVQPASSKCAPPTAGGCMCQPPAHSLGCTMKRAQPGPACIAEIRELSAGPDPRKARELLMAVASMVRIAPARLAAFRSRSSRCRHQVRPIMQRHGWQVGALEEFMPQQPGLLGMNVNRGQRIKLRCEQPRCARLLRGAHAAILMRNSAQERATGGVFPHRVCVGHHAARADAHGVRRPLLPRGDRLARADRCAS